MGTLATMTDEIVYNYHWYSYLFWSDGTNSNAKIERSDLSGHSRTLLVSSAQGLVSPTTLVVDFSSQKLYWLDSAAEKIGHVDFDGSEPFTQTISGLSQVSAMTVYRVRTETVEVLLLLLWLSVSVNDFVVSVMLFSLICNHCRHCRQLFLNHPAFDDFVKIITF